MENMKRNLLKYGAARTNAFYTVRRIASTLLVLGVLASAPAFATPTTCDLEPSLKTALGSAKTRELNVIVRFRNSDVDAQKRLTSAVGGSVYRHLPIIRALAIHSTREGVLNLAMRPEVLGISTDATVAKTDEFTVGASGADIAWKNYRTSGKGVTVAVIDSGIGSAKDLTGASYGDDDDDDDDLHSRIVKTVSFVGGKGEDSCGHGTHVAGILGGNGLSSTGKDYFRTFYGIAPETRLVNLAVLDREGHGMVSSVIAALQWAVQYRWWYGIRIVNLSLGRPVSESYETDPLCLAAKQAWEAGLLVVCAAGNDGRLDQTRVDGLDNEGFGTAYGSIQSPANSPYVLTVGATKQSSAGRNSDRIATYSSRGPTLIDHVVKPDLIAAGNRVISLNAKNNFLFDTFRSTNELPWSYYCKKSRSSSDSYFYLSGTSMAAPVVSGAAALMLQKEPWLSPNTIKLRLMLSADKWADPNGNPDLFTYGAGYLNIPAAIENRAIAYGVTFSPNVVQLDGGDYAVDMTRAIWGARGFYGAGADGAMAVYGSRAIWGARNETTIGLASSTASSFVWSASIPPSTKGPDADLSATALMGEE